MDIFFVCVITLTASMVGMGIMWEMVEDYSVSNPQGPTDGSIEP